LALPYRVSSVGHDIVVMSMCRSWYDTGTSWRVTQAEKEMLILPEHLISPLVFIEVHAILSFVSPSFMWRSCLLDF